MTDDLARELLAELRALREELARQRQLAEYRRAGAAGYGSGFPSASDQRPVVVTRFLDGTFIPSSC